MENSLPKYTKLSGKTSSFQLVRTNPKLTTNLKLTVDSIGDIWLNSIDANSELVNQLYKRVPINENSNHETNIYKFYNNGKTPSSISFNVGSTINISTSTRELSGQYDFDLYTSGAKYLKSKQYSEKFSYFAPLYLGEILPTKFVILKIPGASNYPAELSKYNYENSSNLEFDTDFFKSAQIIKTFDLSNLSKIGKYIQGIIKNQMFTKNPLFVNYKENGYSLYRGISINTGTYVELPEQLITTLTRALPILKIDQYITNGFERNNLIYPKILNLEFLFNDETSDEYSINRYIGFYCNDIDLSNFEINRSSTLTDNDQIIPTTYLESDDISLILTNSNGVKLRGSGLLTNLSDITYNRTSIDTLYFPYLKNRDNDLLSIQSNSFIQNGEYVEFNVDSTSLDFGKLFGPGELLVQDDAQVSHIDTYDSINLQILNKPSHADILRIYHASGTKTAITNTFRRFDDIIFVSNYFDESTAYEIGYDNTELIIYINSDLDVSQISSAISTVIQSLENVAFTATSIDDTIIIRSKIVGNTYGALQVQSIHTNTNQFKINGNITDDICIANGGFSNKSHAIIDSKTVDKILPNINNVIIRTSNNWSKILRFSNIGISVSDIISNNLSKYLEILKTTSTIYLCDDETVDVRNCKIEIRKIFKPSIGVLSFFEVRDIDFSTYFSRYSKNLMLDLYKDFFISPNLNILDFNKYTYKIIGNGTISINGIIYTPDDIATSGSRKLIWQNTQALSKYEIINGEAILVIGNKYPNTTLDPNDPNYLDRLDLTYLDESFDSINYVGPFSIKADHIPTDLNSELFEYRDKYLYGNLASEYGAYLENYTEEFAQDNRVIPCISKWATPLYTDSRENPYRLNTDIVFGIDNFGPSHTETIPTPENLTHEWFYIESNFNYLNDKKLIQDNIWYFENPININDLITKSDYFDEYFTYIPKFNDKQVGHPQFRYSLIYKNPVTLQYETIFKGAKFRFYELDNSGNPIINSTRFTDYKFTCLLKVIPEDPTSLIKPITYRMIENTNSKSITCLIELTLGHYGLINPNVFLNFSPSTNNEITQANVFTDKFLANYKNYSIDTVVSANSYQEYVSYINGESSILSNQAGVIQINYGELSTVFALPNSQLYLDVLSNKISTGDALGTRVYSVVTYPTNILVNSTHYTGVKIEPIINESWAFTTGAVSNGLISSNNDEFSNSTNLITVSSISGEISQYTERFPFLDNGGINQSTTLSLLLNNLDHAVITISDSVNNIAMYKIDSYILNGNVYELTVVNVYGEVLNLAEGSTILIKFNWYCPNRLTGELNTSEISISHNTPYYDSIFGDYRITFNNGVSDLTHSFLYYAKDKKYNTKESAYSTIQLSKGVDLSTSGLVRLNDSIKYIKTVNLGGSNFSNILNSSEISQISNHFSPIYINKPGVNYILLNIDDKVTLNSSTISDPTIVRDGIDGTTFDLINVSNIYESTLNIIKPIFSNFGDLLNYSYVVEPIPTNISSYWTSNVLQFQIFGGFKYFEKIFEELSFAKFSQLLLNPSLISWESYTNGAKTNKRQFSIEPITGDIITKNTINKIEPTYIKYGKINNLSGFSISEVSSTEYSVNRYSTEYDIITNTVSGFSYNFNINQINLIGANIKFNPEIRDFFIIPEFEYVKYSKSTILELENSKQYSPVYPLIDETPISRTSFNILRSSWDYGYHFLSLDKKNEIPIYGSLRIPEDYSFISKLINLPDQLILETFDILEISNSDYLNNSFEFTGLVHSQFNSEIKFKINIANVLSNYLINNGLLTEFEKFFKNIDNSKIQINDSILGNYSFSEYIKKYCIQNLINLYKIDEIEWYEYADKSIENNIINFSTLSYSQLYSLGYTQSRIIKINNIDSNIIEGSTMIRPNSGLTLVPKIKIKYI